MAEGETGGSDIPAEEPTVPTEPYEPYEPDLEEGFGGAPDDQEQPLAEHVDEMVSRLLVVLAVMALASGVVFPFAEFIINFLWFSFLPGSIQQCPTQAASVACPRVYHPMGLIFARLKVATLAGFVVALPVFVYESYLFMRPGLYPQERKYYLASVPTSLVLAGIGLLFAYFLVLPAIFTYFLYYSESAADIALSLGQTFDLMVMMLGFFAVIFQIPLFIMLAIMMGVTSRRWLVQRRLYFWAGFGTIAFIFNPDPTGMAPFLVTATMIALFEGTLGLLYWTGDGSPSLTPDALARARPYIWGLAALAGYLASSLPAPTSYYDQVPGAAIDALASADLVTFLPALVTAGLVVAFEGTNLLLRRLRAAPSLRSVMRRVRVVFWLTAVAAGYLASPDPPLLELAGQVQLSPAATAAVALGLVGTFELVLAGYRWRAGGSEA